MEYPGYKVLIAREVAATPGTYAGVAHVRDIDGPGGTAETVETSHRDSSFRLYQAGMRDGGEVTFDIVFDPDLAGHDPTLSASMYKDWELGRTANYKMTYPGELVTTTCDSTTCIFNTLITTWQFKAPLKDALVASLTLKINGALTWAHVAGS